MFGRVGHLHAFCCCRWFHAEDNVHALRALVASQRHSVLPSIHVLDVFGASGRVTEAWTRHGSVGFSYDIKISREHDICSLHGFLLLLRKGMESPGWEFNIFDYMLLETLVFFVGWVAPGLHATSFPRLALLGQFCNVRLCNDAWIILAPPCSLMGPACSSIHQRSLEHPEGDLGRYKVRLAQRIWSNMAARTMFIWFLVAESAYSIF